MSATNVCYGLISSARNEEAFIAKTIESVATQTVLPRRWIIMDDGSTDSTADIIRDYEKQLPFLHLATRLRPAVRSFHSQYAAVMEAYDLIRNDSFDYIGKVDTDLAFVEKCHFETIFVEMANNPRLGLSGGWIYEDYGGSFERRPGNRDHSVPGGVQLFRRECFEDIGGYRALKYGGSDWLAEIMARMHGWEVRALPTLPVYHCRHTGGFDGALRSALRWGRREASFGTILPFCLLKCVRRLTMKPFLLGSSAWLGGYLSYRLSNESPVIPTQATRYLQQEQRQRICQLFTFPRHTFR